MYTHMMLEHVLKKKKTKTSRRRGNQLARPVFRVGCWNLYQIQEEIKPRVAYWADFLFNTMRELHTSRRAGRATFTQNMSSSQTEPTRAVARSAPPAAKTQNRPSTLHFD